MWIERPKNFKKPTPNKLRETSDDEGNKYETPAADYAGRHGKRIKGLSAYRVPTESLLFLGRYHAIVFIKMTGLGAVILHTGTYEAVL